MNVVLTREPPRNDDIRTVLSLAVNVDEVPATETQSLDPYAVAASCPVVPGTIVVTSSRAVSAAVALAAKFPSAVVAAVGRVTSDHLRTAGIAEVLTADDEGALVDHPGQVAVGGADQREVDLHRAGAADRQHLPLLQRPQKARLQGERHVADLIEEEQAAPEIGRAHV